jgi:NAD(P)H-flavin reductase
MNTCLEAKNFSLVLSKLSAPAKQVSARDYYLTLNIPHYRSWAPGQFVMLRWGEHLIGRPFAIVDWKKKSATTSQLTVWIRELGAATKELKNLSHKNMPVWVTAPLGTAFPSFLLNKKNRILYITGGVGAASILSLKNIRKNYKDFWIHGERSLDDFDKKLKPNPHQVS